MTTRLSSRQEAVRRQRELESFYERLQEPSKVAAAAAGAFAAAPVPKGEAVGVASLLAPKRDAAGASPLAPKSGAAAGVSIPPKLEQVFRRGLRKAALTTKAWIVTGGTKSGVMELVGKTVREADTQVTCIGIAPAGAATAASST